MSRRKGLLQAFTCLQHAKARLLDLMRALDPVSPAGLEEKVFKMIAWYDKQDADKDGEEEQESSNNAELCAQKGAKKDAYSNNSKGAEAVVESV